MFREHINYAKLGNMTKEFEELYNNLYTSNLHKIEMLRKKSIGFFIAVIAIFIIFIFIPGIILKTVCFILALTFLFLGIFYKNKFVSEYKSQVISSFIKVYNSKLSYSNFTYDKAIKQNFVNANFTSEHFDKFYADDYIKGYLDEYTFIRMADIKVQRTVKTDKSSYTVNVFQGIFAFTTSIKNINTYIKISKNNFNLFNSKNAIEMDSSEFEKYFDIYSGNELLTMRILTHDVMDTLVEFYKKSSIPFEIVFMNNIIYLRFFTGPMFEPNIFINSLDKKLLYTNYYILNFIMSVCKNVNKALQEIEI